MNAFAVSIRADPWLHLSEASESQQLVSNNRKLSVNDSEQVRLSAARESEVLRRVCEYLRVSNVPISTNNAAAD
jgi:hypothetical protein